MKFANATNLNRKSGGAKPRDLQFHFQQPLRLRKSTADPSASLGTTKGKWL
jgi:hypothetical protein